ncbi:MAG TPA: peptidylprolyl isomerase [Phycisphaerae bacterium]|nr:peptidylprolyl isomerase [Phycisphaerae bacterium]
MTRQLLAAMVLVPLLLGQQCMEPLPQSSGTPIMTGPAPQVTLHTNRGDIVIELFTPQAPAAARLFQQYVDEGYYDNTVFHLIFDKWIAGGRYKTSLAEKMARPTDDSDPGGLLGFSRGRVALFTPSGVSDAVPEFVIMSDRDDGLASGSYTVCGRVVSGMGVVDTIKEGEATNRDLEDGTSLYPLPAVPVTVNDPCFTEQDYTDPEADPEEDADGIPPRVALPDQCGGAGVIARAKGNRYVAPGVIVTLNGSGSTSPAGSLTYNWRQTDGAPVSLSGADRPKATYEAPNADSNLKFQLTVRDAEGHESTTSITQTVLTRPKVKLETTIGGKNIVFEMLNDPFPAGAPITVRNFCQYVEDGFYNGLIFHRVLIDFVAQAGGYLEDASPAPGIRGPIQNEFSPERSNVQHTVAMALAGGDPNSATSQFFINFWDNSENLDNQNGGFTVFARVIEGLDVVDDIRHANLSPSRIDPQEMSWPMTPIIMERVYVLP